MGGGGGRIHCVHVLGIYALMQQSMSTTQRLEIQHFKGSMWSHMQQILPWTAIYTYGILVSSG